MRIIEGVAPSFGIELSAASVRDPSEIEQAIASFANGSNGGLLMLPSPILTAARQRIISLASLHRLPAIYPFKYLVSEGGRMFYGADNIDQWRQAASYVDRILRGAKPHDLPIQLASKFELVLNLKTAKALGLTIPRDMLLIADELIE
jgi:putative ABC transport system substrate-binding protein